MNRKFHIGTFRISPMFSWSLPSVPKRTSASARDSWDCVPSPPPGLIKLDQIDRKQGDVEEEHRIDMPGQAVDDEQYVARDCHRSKRYDGRHAETRKDCERSRKS
jgi:hypothetical protein